jgi:hypothetical protein
MTDQPGQNPDPTPPDADVPAAAPPPPAPPAAAPPPPAAAPPPPPPPAPPAADSPVPPPAVGYPAPPPLPGYAVAPDGSLDLPYANWGLRVQSALVDWVAGFIIAAVAYAISHPLGELLWLAALAWGIYNSVLGGQTGQSYGKKMVGTKVVGTGTLEPIGGAMGFGRLLLHILDSIPCYLGYLWPLWDSKRQTFSDKVIGTYVLKV